jgi:hypothetical protein
MNIEEQIIKKFNADKLYENFERKIHEFDLIYDSIIDLNESFYDLFIKKTELFENYEDFYNKYCFEHMRSLDLFEVDNYQGVIIGVSEAKYRYKFLPIIRVCKLNSLVKTIKIEYENIGSKTNKLSKLLSKKFTTIDREIIIESLNANTEIQNLINDLFYYFLLSKSYDIKQKIKYENNDIIDPEQEIKIMKGYINQHYDIKEERKKIEQTLFVRYRDNSNNVLIEKLSDSFFMSGMIVSKDTNELNIMNIMNKLNPIISYFLKLPKIEDISTDLVFLKFIISQILPYDNFEKIFTMFVDAVETIDVKNSKYYKDSMGSFAKLFHLIFVIAFVFKFNHSSKNQEEKKELYEEFKEFDYLRFLFVDSSNSSKSKKVKKSDDLSKNRLLKEITIIIESLKNKFRPEFMYPEKYMSVIDRSIDEFKNTFITSYVFRYSLIFDPPKQYFFDIGLFKGETDFNFYTIKIPYLYCAYDYVRRRTLIHFKPELFEKIDSKDENSSKLEMIELWINKLSNINLNFDDRVITFIIFVAAIFEYYSNVSAFQYYHNLYRELKSNIIFNNITTKRFIDSILYTFINKYDKSLGEPSLKYTTLEEIDEIMKKIFEITLLYSNDYKKYNAIIEPSDFMDSINQTINKMLNTYELKDSHPNIKLLKDIFIKQLETKYVELYNKKEYKDDFTKKRNEIYEKYQVNEQMNKISEEYDKLKLEQEEQYDELRMLETSELYQKERERERKIIELERLQYEHEKMLDLEEKELLNEIYEQENIGTDLFELKQLQTLEKYNPIEKEYTQKKEILKNQFDILINKNLIDALENLTIVDNNNYYINAKNEMILIPSNFDISGCWPDNKIPLVKDLNNNYGYNRFTKLYNNIIEIILIIIENKYVSFFEYLRSEESFFKYKKILEQEKFVNLNDNTIIEKIINKLSLKELDRLEKLFLSIYNYRDFLLSFNVDFNKIFTETYEIINKHGLNIVYTPNTYKILNYELNANSTMHIDLLTMKYYWGIGKYHIYDPIKGDSDKIMLISQYRLTGFEQMIEKYRNNYNYLVGVYYNSKTKPNQSPKYLSDLQIGISGSFNWWYDPEKFKDIQTLLQHHDIYNLLVLDQNVFIELPIYAAQREIYEETRMFFEKEDIKFESFNVHNGFGKESRIVYSFFVDVKNCKIKSEIESKEIFKQPERFYPITNIFNHLNKFIEENYHVKNINLRYELYHRLRKQPDNIFDNPSIKVSVLIAGNDLRDVLKITNPLNIKKELNDNIRMVSCVGKNIDIKKYPNYKEYKKKAELELLQFIRNKQNSQSLREQSVYNQRLGLQYLSSFEENNNINTGEGVIAKISDEK